MASGGLGHAALAGAVFARERASGGVLTGNVIDDDLLPERYRLTKASLLEGWPWVFPSCGAPWAKGTVRDTLVLTGPTVAPGPMMGTM